MKEWEIYRKAHERAFENCVVFEQDEPKQTYSISDGLMVAEMAIERGMEDLTEWALIIPDSVSMGAVVIDDRGMPTDTIMVFI